MKQCQISFKEKIINLLKLVYQFILDSNVASQAGAMAYVFTLSLIPLLTTVLAFFTAFPGLSSERNQLVNLLYSQLLPSVVREVQPYMDQFVKRATAAGAVSTIVFFILVLFLYQSIERNFNFIWRSLRERTWVERFQSLGVFLVSSAIAVAVFIAIYAQASILTSKLHTSQVVFEKVSLELSGLFVAWGLFTLSNKALPNTEVKWIPSIISGVCVGSIWHFLKKSFTWYVNNLASYENLYGALGVVPALLFWTYLSFFLLLVGSYTAFIIQNYQDIIAENQNESFNALKIFYGCLLVVLIAQKFDEYGKLQTVEELSQEAQLPPYFVKKLLNILCFKKLLLEVNQGHNQYYALAKPSQMLKVKQVINSIQGRVFDIPEMKQTTKIQNNVKQFIIEIDITRDRYLKNCSVADLTDIPQKNKVLNLQTQG